MWEVYNECEGDSNCRGFTTTGYKLLEQLPPADSDDGWSDLGSSDCDGTFYDPQTDTENCMFLTALIHSSMGASGFQYDESKIQELTLSNGDLIFDYQTNAAANRNYKTVCNEAGGEFMVQTFTATCGGTTFEVIDHPRCYSTLCDAEVTSSLVQGEHADALFQVYAIQSTEARNNVTCSSAIMTKESSVITQTSSVTEGDNSTTLSYGTACPYETTVLFDDINLKTERNEATPSGDEAIKFLFTFPTQDLDLTYTTSDTALFKSQCEQTENAMFSTQSTTVACSDATGNSRQITLTDFPVCVAESCNFDELADTDQRSLVLGEIVDRMTSQGRFDEWEVGSLDCSGTVKLRRDWGEFLSNNKLLIAGVVAALLLAVGGFFYVQQKLDKSR
jgi:hypothetical protein